MEGSTEVKESVTIPLGEYQVLKRHSHMLSQINGVVSRYARRAETTTYECVVRLKQHQRQLAETLKELKKERSPEQHPTDDTAWKARYADAVERLAGKLHCAEDCKCSARQEVRMLREILQGKINGEVCE
jgi:hypothetical protein